MNCNYHERVIIVSPFDTIELVISALANKGDKLGLLALVLESESQKLVGVLSQGDVIRLIANKISLSTKIGNVMNKNPITAPVGLSKEELLRHIVGESNKMTSNDKNITRFVPIVDSTNNVINVEDVFELMRTGAMRSRVLVYGLGFVGITLSAVLAANGHQVAGIDKSKLLLDRLKKNKSTVYEPRLEETINNCRKAQRLSFYQSSEDLQGEVSIIAVGTPVREDGSADLSMLEDVANTIALKIKKGDLILRSTVPVGTTRQITMNIFEKKSGLIAGKDFHVVFSPERTVEGAAMVELQTLPQVIGGITESCCALASSFWQTIANTTVVVDSLESAELVKLINNSFRDLSFAFSNGLALLADQYNVDANKLISAANEGYPRNKIPSASPGVGGYCLTKDPFLYSSCDPESYHAKLATNGRAVNIAAADYPLEVVERFSRIIQKDINELKVLVVGIAFKGIPATNDIRGSSGLHVAEHLRRKKAEVDLVDAVVSKKIISSLGFNNGNLREGLKKYNCIMLMNNHPLNVPDKFLACLQDSEVLVFDGWSLLDRHQVEEYPNLYYSSMGYMTNKAQKY